MQAKKVLMYVGIAFVIFFLLKEPGEAAGAVKSAMSGLASAADSLSTFVSQLT